MSDDFYVMFEGQRYEADDFADGVSYAKDLGPSAVLYAAGGSTTSEASIIYAEGVNLTITGGIFEKTLHTGFSSEGAVDSQTIRLEGGTIGGASSNLVIGAVGGTIGSIDFTMTGGVIGQHLQIGDGAAAVGPVTANLLGGPVTKRIFCSSSNATGSQGDPVINIDGL